MNDMLDTPTAPGLRALLAGGRFVVAPGVYDMFSARIADRMGFDALYMTGYGIAASHLGLPDAGLASWDAPAPSPRACRGR